MRVSVRTFVRNVNVDMKELGGGFRILKRGLDWGVNSSPSLLSPPSLPEM